MERPISEDHVLHRWFRGLTEATFLTELGIGDPRLVGYLADLLARFVAGTDGATPRPARPTDLLTLLAEAERSADDLDRRACYRRLGDHALFWLGMYPEMLAGRRSARPAEVAVDLRSQGKRSYYLASTVAADDAPVLRRLSDEFDACAWGLAQVRREWENGPTGYPRGVIAS